MKHNDRFSKSIKSATRPLGLERPNTDEKRVEMIIQERYDYFDCSHGNEVDTEFSVCFH